MLFMKIWIENDYWENTIAKYSFVIIFIGIKYTSPYISWQYVTQHQLIRLFAVKLNFELYEQKCKVRSKFLKQFKYALKQTLT